MKKSFYIILMLTFLAGSICAQNIGINDDGSSPDNSAILDVKSTTKGMLIPQMTRVQRNAIINPANGLMVLCTNCGADGSLSIYLNGSWKTFSPCAIASPIAGTHMMSQGQIIWNWNAVTGAFGYKWNTTPDYETAIDMASATNKTETGTICGTEYTRYVWAYSSCSESSLTSLTATVPDAVPVNPVASTHIASQTSIIWNWNMALYATGYKWNTVDDYASAIEMEAATTKTETGLICGMDYTRYVWAYNGCGYSLVTSLNQSTAPYIVPPAPVEFWLGHTVYETSIVWCWEVVPVATGYKWNMTDDYASALEMGTAISKTETGLTCNTAYTRYVWAYNGCGHSLVTSLSASTTICLLMPTVQTAGVTYITKTTATSGGNVTDDGGGTVFQRGVCWSLSPNPTTADNKTIDGNGNGIFTSTLTNLIPSTLYYVKAYATNSAGTAYGGELSFTTREFDIGQAYGGGVIFYLDGTGKHGLIYASIDQSTGAQWGCYGTSIQGTSNAIGSGQANTTLIVNGCSDAGNAARICDELVLNGYSDWFLPSKDEMYELNTVNGPNGFSSIGYYWTSSESSATKAWGQSFDWMGWQYENNKNVSNPVRAIRAF